MNRVGDMGLSIGFFAMFALFGSLNYATIFNIAPAQRYGKSLLWDKLSNSGEILKLMIPSYIWKYISRWINHSLMVISHKMKETEMDNRGSKSVFNKFTVKEQRLDGSLCFKQKHIRCNLTGLETGYQLKIPSKQFNINNRTFSTLISKSKINPWFVTGLVDGEGTFVISIQRNNNLKLGWYVKCRFAINLHKRDLSFLLKVQEFFGGIGAITKSKTTNSVSYSVETTKDLLNVIIPHFTNYKLLTQKGADFLLFTQVVKLLSKKAHLTIEGLQEIINIRASINLGLSDLLKTNFINTIPVERPKIIIKNNLKPNWIAGFVNGESNFNITIQKNKALKTGHRVQIRFRIYQDERDLNLLALLIKYFGAGRIEKHKSTTVANLTITNLSTITKIIIPFFEKYPILGVKYLDYLDWCEVANLMSDGKHLTIEGLDLIRTIKSRMNRGRKV